MSRILELRIHGVSGTPPEEMLQTERGRSLTADDVVRVDTDPVVAFYQRKDPPYGPDHVLEAYNWSSLTSGTWVKGLWLLLVPFGLVNAAHFMLPRYRSSEPPAREAHRSPTGPAPDSRRSARADDEWSVGRVSQVVAEAALRMLGLVQTLVFALAVAEALIDLVAWQAKGDRAWLLTAVVLTGLVAVLVFLFGARGRTRRASLAPPSSMNPLARHTGLAAAEFELGDPDIPSLTRLHLGAVGAMLGWLCFTAWSDLDGDPVSGGWIRTHGAVICAWTAVAIAAAVLLIGNPHRDAVRWRAVAVRAVGWVGATVGAAGWLFGAYTLLAVDISPANRRSSLPGIDALTRIALFSSVGAIAVLTLACAAMAAAGRSLAGRGPWRRYLFGLTSPVLASVGTLLGVGFGAAVVLTVKWMVELALPSGASVELPSLYPRIAGAWALNLGQGLLAALVLLLLWLFRRKRFQEAVRLAHNVEPRPPGPPVGSTAIRRIAFAWWAARVKMHVQWMFCVFAAVGLVLSGLAVNAAINTGSAGCSTQSPAVATLGSAVPCGAQSGSALVVIGTVTLIAVAVGLGYLGWKSVRNSHWRRSANVVWDVVAFWPRAAHPLVPPPYTAVALDRLRARLYFYLGRCADPAAHAGQPCTCPKAAAPVDNVLLAAHSQGSLLAVAALAELRWATGSKDPDDGIRPGEIGLLTFGSQLQFAYARGFPRYVNVDLLRELVALRAQEFRWLNLMRETDPVGGQVLSDRRTMSGEPRSDRLDNDGEILDHPDRGAPGGVRVCGDEWRLLDPAIGPLGEAPIMLRHSGYFLDPNWDAAIAALTPSLPRSRNPVPTQASGSPDVATGTRVSARPFPP
ncbi:hypothetical protein [Nakamurella panacisegetis]|uniref:hypothetical protein n=1 Tax=Nakamurella panacisegetis TaxID=1090615 RepID=UPI000B84B245|nr:hypothetical protein [Nakamurella panacisegetis]